MSYSYVTYTGDGTTQDYIVPFPYLKISDVKVSLDEAEQNALAYSWHTSGTIRFVTAPPDLRAGLQACSRRVFAKIPAWLSHVESSISVPPNVPHHLAYDVRLFRKDAVFLCP